MNSYYYCSLHISLLFFTVSSSKDFYILRLLLVSKFITLLLQMAIGSPKGGVEELEFREIELL
jgi:hypothetical protein